MDMINYLLNFVLTALATGGAVVVSQYIGRKEKDQACNAASQLITVTTIISSGIMLFVILFHKPTLRILFGSVEDDVMAAAITYFVISGLSYPFFGIYNSCAALFRSMEKSHITMNVSDECFHYHESDLSIGRMRFSSVSLKFSPGTEK